MIVKAYPTRLIIAPLDRTDPICSCAIRLKGPFKGFTLMQELEKGFVRIYGAAKEGYFSLRLKAEAFAVTLTVEKSPKEGILFLFEEGKRWLDRNQTLDLVPLLEKRVLRSPLEKVHFGCHKKQDWTLVQRRLNLEEILPFWFALGSQSPCEPSHFEGAATLLQECEQAIERKDRLEIGSLFLKLFQVGFYGMLTPRLFDTDFQGILPEKPPTHKPALVLLEYGARLIKKLFLDIKDSTLFILPCLPVELDAGSFQGAKFSNRLKVDIKWSKKVIRCVTLQSYADQNLRFSLQKGLKSFRLGRKRVPKEALLELKSGKTYFFDRFER